MAYEALKKCQPCDGTGDMKRRALPPESPSRQQCRVCRGEGQALDLDDYEERLEAGEAMTLEARDGNYSVCMVDAEAGETPVAISERMFMALLTLGRAAWARPSVNNEVEEFIEKAPLPDAPEAEEAEEDEDGGQEADNS